MVVDWPCPRCGEMSKRLIYPYWDSPFAEGGGLCVERCVPRAEKKFELFEWPPMPEDKDWNRFPENCPCGGKDEFCPDCNGTGIRWTDEVWQLT